jgi:DNA helicase-2/ATP-dependent DNA helicase PcrA
MSTLNINVAGITPHNPPVDIEDQPKSTGRVWSPYQQAIFAHIEDPNGGNAIVEAVAGSGKSTTIKEGLKYARGSTIFLAFNKAIADELKKAGVNARTFHSLVFGPVMRARRQQNPEMNKLRILCQANLTKYEFELYATFMQKLVGLARGMGIGCLLPNVRGEWFKIVDHHQLEPEHADADLSRAVDLSMELLDWSCADQRVDFDDMLYFAVKDKLALQTYDFVFVDEAQDTNPIQRALLRKIMHNRSRLVAVGDPAQAIYGFRGADSESMGMIAREFNCKTLPLSISYRCPTAVVKYARQWVNHIEAAPGAKEGLVGHLGTKWEPSFFRAGDLMVSRKTAPLITTAFKFIRAGVPVVVMGREIGQGLKALIKKMKVSDIDLLSARLDEYRAREVKLALAKMDEQKAEAITDRVECIQFMIDSLAEGYRTIPELETAIDYLFADKGQAVIFATIHKSKGLEAPRVFWLGRAECPAKWARMDWQRQQEINLCYVATTRAMEELYTLELP